MGLSNCSNGMAASRPSWGWMQVAMPLQCQTRKVIFLVSTGIEAASGSLQVKGRPATVNDSPRIIVSMALDLTGSRNSNDDVPVAQFPFHPESAVRASSKWCRQGTVLRTGTIAAHWSGYCSVKDATCRRICEASCRYSNISSILASVSSSTTEVVSVGTGSRGGIKRLADPSVINVLKEALDRPGSTDGSQFMPRLCEQNIPYA